MDVLVFKTSVTQPTGVRLLTPDLDRLAGQGTWNFDLSDCDHILRIDSREVNAEAAIQLLATRGYACEELTD